MIKDPKKKNHDYLYSLLLLLFTTAWTLAENYKHKLNYHAYLIKIHKIIDRLYFGENVRAPFVIYSSDVEHISLLEI